MCTVLCFFAAGSYFCTAALGALTVGAGTNFGVGDGFGIVGAGFGVLTVSCGVGVGFVVTAGFCGGGTGLGEKAGAGLGVVGVGLGVDVARGPAVGGLLKGVNGGGANLVGSGLLEG